MNKMQETLARAAKELRIRAEIDYVVTLSDGRSLRSQALFPDLGNLLGTLVFCTQDNVEPSAKRDLVSQGYGVSAFSAPLPDEIFEIENYAEMFSEWGWAGSSNDKPKWMD
jgi:hypothetical protein